MHSKNFFFAKKIIMRIIYYALHIYKFIFKLNWMNFLRYEEFLWLYVESKNSENSQKSANVLMAN